MNTGVQKVELFPIDPRQSPLPDCLQSLGRLNITIDYDAAGAMMAGRKCKLTSMLLLGDFLFLLH